MTPQLDLGFVAHPHAGVRLDRRRAAWPFAMTQPFRLEGGDWLTVIVQSASGAVLGGDRLLQRVAVGEGARATVGTEAAMAVHDARGDCAEERVELSVAGGAVVEWLPAPRILFPGAALRQTLSVTAADGGVAIVADGFATHDPAGLGRPFRRFAGAFEVRRPCGAPLAAERFALDGPPGRFGGAAAMPAHGTLAVICPGGATDLAALAAAMEAAVEASTGADVFAAASALPREAGVSLRAAARDGGRLRRALMAARAAARLRLTGVPPPARPA